MAGFFFCLPAKGFWGWRPKGPPFPRGGGPVPGARRLFFGSRTRILFLGWIAHTALAKKEAPPAGDLRGEGKEENNQKKDSDGGLTRAERYAMIWHSLLVS